MSLQHNVQQQNKLAFDVIRDRAQYFRAGGIPVGVRRFFATQGIDTDTSVIARALEAFMLQLDYGLGGMLLTANHKFFAFELELNAALTEVIFVYKFTDVTSQQDMFTSNRGTGKGFGALALAVLDAVNA